MKSHVLDIRRLRYFRELASVGHYSQAAMRLGIAQSALSMAISKLEKDTGLKLINRAERQMTLTSDGEALYRHAGVILQNVLDAERELADIRGLESGIVKFGASSMLSSYYLPSVLAAFKQRYPGVRVNLIEAGTATLQQMILDGELDLALIRTDRAHEQIRYVDLLVEEIVACVPRDHRFALRSGVTLEEFCREPLVLFREGYLLREAVSRCAQKEKLTLDIRFETNLIELLKSLVVNRVGISTGLSMIIGHEDQLVAVPFEPEVLLHLGLGWKRNHYLSKASGAFISFIEEHLQINRPIKTKLS